MLTPHITGSPAVRPETWAEAQCCYLRTLLPFHQLVLRCGFPLPESHRAFTCDSSLGSSNLGQFLILSLSFLNLIFLKHEFVATLVAQTVKTLPAMQDRPGLDPWVGKIPWRRTWEPTPVFLPGEPHGRRSLVGYSPWGRKELDTSEWLVHTHMQLFCSMFLHLDFLGIFSCLDWSCLLPGRITPPTPARPLSFWAHHVGSARCRFIVLLLMWSVVICLRWCLLDLPIRKLLLSLCD